MKRNATALLVSGALMFGAATAKAALPDEATLYKTRNAAAAMNTRHLEALGVDVTIIDDVELGDIKQQAGVPYGMGFATPLR